MTAKADTHWEHFAHQADIGIRGWGPSMESAFEQAALALTAVIAQPESVQPREWVTIRVEGRDSELLFVDWLNALLSEMAIRRMLFSRFEVTLRGPLLEARAGGEPVDVKRHKPAVEVKAASYAGLSVAQNADGQWCAQCIVDV